MDKIKSVTIEKLNFKDNNVFLYILACAFVLIQPLLELISSMVINAGKANFISVSGAVRAIFMLAILVCSWAFYDGKYKKLFSAYLSGVSVYIFIVCLMTAIRGTTIASAYMIGLMADTFFFHFAFIAMTELYYTMGRRISPMVTTMVAVIYALTLAVNHLFDKTNSFNFSSSFAVVLALLIPIALVHVASQIGKFKSDDKLIGILSYVLPIIGIVIVLFGAIFSNSKAVLFISIIFSVIFFVWSFSGWRNSIDSKRSKYMIKGFVSSAAFCVLILAFLPISPIKSSFDGTFKISEIFYTYNGSAQSGIPSENPEDKLPFTEDDPDNGDSDYVPILDSGYDPDDEWNQEDDEDTDETSSKSTTESSKTTEPKTTDPSTTDSEPAGDEPSSEEVSDTTLEETTNRWQLPTIDMSDIDNFLSTFPIPPVRPSESTTEITEKDSETALDEESSSETAGVTNEVPIAAIGIGRIATKSNYAVSNNTIAINLDKVKYFSDSFFGSNMETWLFGLRFSGLFNEDITPALKVKSDPISVLLNYGFLGFIAYILPILFVFIKVLKFLLLKFSFVFESFGLVTYIFITFAILFLSLFDGDVFAFSAVGSIAAVVFANVFTLCEEKNNIT